MRSVYDFIVEPVGERYDNELKVGDKKLVLNSKIESHKFINNKAKVISVPIAFKTPIKVGDELLYTTMYLEDTITRKVKK